MTKRHTASVLCIIALTNPFRTLSHFEHSCYTLSLFKTAYHTSSMGATVDSIPYQLIFWPCWLYYPQDYSQALLAGPLWFQMPDSPILQFSTIITITFCYNTSYYTVVLPDIIMCWGVLLLLCQSPPSLLCFVLISNLMKGCNVFSWKSLPFIVSFPPLLCIPSHSLCCESARCKLWHIVKPTWLWCTWLWDAHILYSITQCQHWSDVFPWCTYAHGMLWNSRHCYKT